MITKHHQQQHKATKQSHPLQDTTLKDDRAQPKRPGTHESPSACGYEHQRGQKHTFIQAKLIQLARNGLAAVEEIVDVSGALVADAEDGPKGLALSLALMRVRFSCSIACPNQ